MECVKVRDFTVKFSSYLKRMKAGETFMVNNAEIGIASKSHVIKEKGDVQHIEKVHVPKDEEPEKVQEKVQCIEKKAEDIKNSNPYNDPLPDDMTTEEKKLHGIIPLSADEFFDDSGKLCKKLFACKKCQAEKPDVWSGWENGEECNTCWDCLLIKHGKYAKREAKKLNKLT